MNIGMLDAIRGCRLQEYRVETIANNLANATTTGFKKDILYFDQFLEAHQQTNTTQGDVKHTGNALDVALTGEGFFKVNTAAGIRYTRNGRFLVNGEGALVTSSGDPVLGESGPITVEDRDVSIDEKGAVIAGRDEVDTLAVVTFAQPERLRKEGASYYVYEGEEGGEQSSLETRVNQGYLEESNVVVTEEVIHMVEALRQFESYQKVLQALDEADAKVINEVGKI